MAAAKGANSDKENQQSSLEITTKDGDEGKEQTNVGKFVHFQ